MKKAFVLMAVLALLCLGGLAQAAVIDTVPVGDPGNQGDKEIMNDGSTGYGSVGYEFRMGKYEVTAGQYTAFLNAVAATDTYALYNTQMWSEPYGAKIQRNGSPGGYTYNVAADWANRPVNYVSFWDAVRFANWLHNRQPTGLQDPLTTEDGAYAISGYNGFDGRHIQRKPGARWFLPTEDEWYKAAYYKGGGENAGYSNYATRSDAAPANQVLSADPGNSADYYINDWSVGTPYYRTNVGEFENSGSSYGTYDQSGNLSEWNEAIPYSDTTYAYRGIRGGAFVSTDSVLHASHRHYYFPSNENYDFGFRVAEAVPEPSGLLALGSGLLALGGLIRRRR